MSWAIAIVVLLAVASAVIQRRGTFFVQYLFFLRYPLFLALFLVFGPILAVTAGRALVGNLFVLDVRGIVLVTMTAVFTAGTIVYTFTLIFALTHARTKLPFFRRVRSEGTVLDQDRQKRWARWLGDHQRSLSIALMLPLAAVLAIRSPLPWFWSTPAVAAGILAAEFVRLVVTRKVKGGAKDVVELIWPFLEAIFRPSWAKPPRWLRRTHEWLISTFEDGFSEPTHLDWERRALTFFLVTAVLYVLGFVASMVPAGGGKLLSELVPVPVYLLVLVMLAGWISAFLSFYFDKFRIPALAPVLILWIASYSTAPDHYFGLNRAAAIGTAPAAPCQLSPRKAVEGWLGRQQGRKPTMVLVAASGGGITASLWTARVLTALSSSDEGLGPEFARAITLISTASGGGVGAAYFVDAYRPDAEFDATTSARVLAAAGASSLQPTVFAFTYNELCRFFVPFACDDRADRGWALEDSWARNLSAPSIMLHDWRPGIEQGWRPSLIFNVTITETGSRLLLGAADPPTPACDKSPWRAESLDTLYGSGSDMRVVTAARLSATFPWVTPLSRAPREERRGFHLADGGYYDNFGVVTALEWLSTVSEQVRLRDKVGKILVLQVRASPDERRADEDRPEDDRPGWFYAAFGPLVTLTNVRTTSQRNHNDAQLVVLKSLFAMQGIRMETVEFELDALAPLSWHLTEEEKKTIVDDWRTSDVIREKRARLECLWLQPTDKWEKECRTDKPIALDSPDGPAMLYERVRKDIAQRSSRRIAAK